MENNQIKYIILTTILVLGILILFTLIYKLFKQGINNKNFWHASWICFITDFLDNIGIGCFAPQTYIIQKLKLITLKNTPGTLNVSYIGAAIGESFMSLSIIKVDMTTLISNVISAILGAIIGTKIVHLVNENKMKYIIGLGLLFAAFAVSLKLFNILPTSGMLTSLNGWKLYISIFASFLIGIGITFGIGNFAPTLAVFLILGFDPKSIFPVMMITAAFTSIIGSTNFIKNNDYDLSFSVSGFIFGLLGVILSGLIIFNLPSELFKSITLIVILFTSISILSKKNTSNLV